MRPSQAQQNHAAEREQQHCENDKRASGSVWQEAARRRFDGGHGFLPSVMAPALSPGYTGVRKTPSWLPAVTR